MKIKDLQQFRSDWKRDQGYPNTGWDADFLGATHGKINGFYKMVNGIVNDIKADLVPKLQNAQDEQAIYEFLQNAADADAQDCAVIYDEDFFLVLNNGNPFREKDIKAILNAFQGTKADKTRPENCGKIGRYGIGFKLAHRLVGKSDGADELIRDLAGPILFSWHNNEAFEALKNRKTTDSFEQIHDPQTPASASWLLKIVLSCFPAMPGESVKDLNFEPRVVFEEKEIQELSDFLNRHEAQIQNMDLSQGALFFLRFGPKKHDKLDASITNLKSGIGYALNSLKQLDHVVLQDEPIEAFEIETETFELQPGTESFQQIDPEFPFCPIQIMVGFHQEPKLGLQLKQAPNLYQYFPMRNERHQLAFLVHSTSFAKVTDRTRLDDKGEANLETFQYLVQALEERMNELQGQNFERFTQLFQAILLSDRPEKGDIVHTHLYDPLMDYIRLQIPTQKGNCYPGDVVVLKQTELPVEPIHFGIGKEWFYWSGEKDNRLLRTEAAKIKKLGLASWSLADLLKAGNPDLISRWIQKLDGEVYRQFIVELKEASAEPSIKPLLETLACFRFLEPNGKARFYTLEELKSQDQTFLVGEKTEPIRTILQALGFSVLPFDYDAFSDILGQDKAFRYLYQDPALMDRIASRTAHNTLDNEQRQRLWDFIQELDGLMPGQFRDLALFPDRKGTVKPLSSLLAPTDSMDSWMDNYVIDGPDNLESIIPYLASSDRMFSRFMFPFWEDLISDSKVQDDLPSFFKDVIKAFQKDKQKRHLGDLPFVAVGASNVLLPENEVWFHRGLQDFEGYALSDDLLDQAFGLRLPSLDMLEFLNHGPFKIKSIQSRVDWKTIQPKLNKPETFESFPFSRRKAFFTLLSQAGLSAQLMKRIPLFQNKKGVLTPLGDLLPPNEAYPDWIADQEIDADEFYPELTPYLITADRIYLDLILRNWEAFTREDRVLADPAAFYEGVKTYFDLSRNKSKFQQQAYVYTDSIGRFMDRKSTYFHQELAEQEDYEALRHAIEMVSGLKIPDVFILPYLNEDPFKTISSPLLPKIKSAQFELKEQEVRALIRFFEDTRTSFFSQFVLTKGISKGTFILERKGKNIQVYLGSDRSKNYQTLAPHLPEGYKILPANFYDEQTEQGNLLSGEVLYKELMKKVDPSVFGDLVQTGKSDPILEKEFIHQLDEVIFEEGVAFEADSLPVKLVQAFRKRDSNPEALRKKIVLVNASGERFPLHENTFSDWISMKGQTGEPIRLRVTDLLPDLAPIFILKHQLLEQFDADDRNHITRKVFEDGSELPASKVARLLQQANPILENGVQLAFAVLLGDESPLMMRNFKVHTLSGTVKRLSEKVVWLTRPSELFESEATLDSRYEHVIQVLNPNDESSIAWSFGKQVLLSEPSFIGDQFYSPKLEKPSSEETLDQGAWLDLMFEAWNSLDEAPKAIHWSVLEDQIGSILKTAVHETDFALPGEHLPDWLRSWKGKQEEKTSFLEALGIKGMDHSSIALRACLAGKQENFDRKTFNAIQKNDPSGLKNAIRWSFEKQVIFDPEQEPIQWLRRTFRAIESHTDLALPALRVKDGQLTYQLVQSEVHSISAQKLERVPEKYGISILDLIQKLESQNLFLCDLDFKTFQLNPIKLEAQLNVEKLENEAKEWTVNYYQEWKRERGFEIYLTEGEMPYRLFANGLDIHSFQQENATTLDQGIFLNKETENLEELLFTLAHKSKGLTDKHLAALLRLKNKFSKRDFSDKLFNRPVKHIIEQNQVPETEPAKWALIDHLKSETSNAWNLDPIRNQKGPWFEVQKQDQTIHLLLHPIRFPDVILDSKTLLELEKPDRMIALYDGVKIKMFTLGNLWKNKSYKIRLDLDEKTWKGLQKKSGLPKET